MDKLTLLSNKALENLKAKKLPPTPQNYEKEFFELSKKDNVVVQDKIDLDKLINDLCNLEKAIFEKENNNTSLELSKILNTRINQSQIKYFLKDLSYFMSPSLSKELKSDILSLCEDISTHPNELINIDTIRKLRKITKERIDKDKLLFGEKADDVKGLIRFLAKVFTKTVDINNITIEKLAEIKSEINNLKLSDSSLKHMKILHSKLLDTLSQFEESVRLNSMSILTTQKETNSLQEQIEDLKKSLDKAEEEKSIDFLTKVLTRRAFTIEQEKIENEFNIFDSNYAIVFFDIDHFKKINDTLGHDCGDSVLFTFASILKKLTRSEDIICRYGGEEFITIVHYKNKLEVKNYLKRVKNIMNNNKFVYKNNKIEVKFSAGVTFRVNHNSYDDALVNADKLLYKAKKQGRNKIILDTEEEL